MPGTGGQIVGYDLTLKAESIDRAPLMKFLQEWFKKWVFQKEKGETGYVHWQVRAHFMKPKNVAQAVKWFNDQDLVGHISPTSSEVHGSNSFQYVMKADTRIEGPWSDKDFEEPPVLTRRIKKFMTHEMYSWQKQMLAMLDEEPDDRTIHVIYDDVGCAGKSSFCDYMEYTGRAYDMPPFRQMEDMMQCAMSIKEQNAFLIDMPRGMKKDKLGEFYSGLESLKNGVCYDKRYAFKKRKMESPHVIVFTNTVPDLSLLSRDRWKIWVMQPDKSLTHHVTYDPDDS